MDRKKLVSSPQSILTPTPKSDSTLQGNSLQFAPYHLKYRPKVLGQVIGQPAVVAAIESLFKRGNIPHAFIFSGPSGTGKTTLARILASMLGCEPAGIIEADAATYSGVDAIKSITATLPYTAFGDHPNKVVILDECHSLTKNAWQALLKSIEEPPPHVYFCLCTTEPSKIPATISNRCHSFALKPAPASEISGLIDFVCDEEKLPVPDNIRNEVIKYAEGSIRKALVGLSTVSECLHIDDARDLLNRIVDEDSVIELCRTIAQRSKATGWDKSCKILDGIDNQNLSSASIVIQEYLASCVLRAKTDNERIGFIELLDIFNSTQVNSKPGMVLALARTFFT